MNWPQVAIAECARVVSGATPKTGVPDYWDGDVPWVTPKDLASLDGKLIRETPRKITPAGLRSCSAQLLPANSVLFSSRAPIGHVAINSVPMATNQGFKSFVPSKNLDPSFLYWWLRCHRAQLEALGNGATFKEVSKAVVERIAIPLPPLDEQKRIAAILDQADDLRRLRQRAIDRLTQLGHSIFWEMFGDPLRNENRYEIVEVGKVADCIVPGRDKPKSFSGDIPWITTSELKHLGYTDARRATAALTRAELQQVRARLIPARSVLITCVGDLGVCSIAEDEMVINQQLHSFQCSDKVTPEYLMYGLSYQKPWMLKMATQTTLPYMNKTICNSIPIQVPGIKSQKKFSARIVAINWELRTNEIQAGTLCTLFDALQQRAFRGEL